MAKIGVLIETENNTVKEPNMGVITAARANGDNEVIALAPEGTDKGGLAAYGVTTTVTLTSTNGDMGQSPDLEAAMLENAISHLGLDGLLGLASARGRDLFARLAARLNQPLASDLMGINFSTQTALKSHFSGKTIATLKLDGSPLLATIRPNAIEAVEAPVEAAEQDLAVNVQVPHGVTIREIKKGDESQVDLTEAAVIITAGRPIDSADNYKIIEACAAEMGAAVGASRAAVDAGFAPHSMQVGQTGKTVSPRLYIGCGLSGSVQHFAGMKTSKVIVAINTDKDAPIFQKCDYGIIGDLFEVVPMLTEELKK